MRQISEMYALVISPPTEDVDRDNAIPQQDIINAHCKSVLDQIRSCVDCIDQHLNEGIDIPCEELESILASLEQFKGSSIKSQTDCCDSDNPFTDVGVDTVNSLNVGQAQQPQGTFRYFSSGGNC